MKNNGGKPMTYYTEEVVHCFEAGRRGKPDELDSIIANVVAAEFLRINPEARFDIRVHGGYARKEERLRVRISGEVSEVLLQNAGVEPRLTEAVVNQYNRVHCSVLTPEDFLIGYEFNPQASPLALNDEAGDSGNAIAVAFKDGPQHLPWERYVAVGIRDFIDTAFQKNVLPLQGLRADGKVRVEAVYEDTTAHLRRISKITIAAEHEESLPVEKLREELERGVRAYLQAVAVQHDQYLGDVGEPKIEINTLGGWHEGGWKADEGSRDAKSYRDGFASHGCTDDSFGGEDPTKCSGAATFLARALAVEVVQNNFADFARVALSYTIGKPEVEINVSTQRTARVPQARIEKYLRTRFSLQRGIRGAIEQFGLRDPELYQKFVDNADYFQDASYPWEKAQPWDPRENHL